MPPTRFDSSTRSHSQSVSARQTRPRRSRARPQRLPDVSEDVIVLSSDDEDAPCGPDVIVISSDDEDDARPPPIAGHRRKLHCSLRDTGKGSRLAPYNRGATAIPSGPATLVCIDSGAFGDPSTWSFGLPEPNHVDLQKIFEEIRDHPTMFTQYTEREKTQSLREIREKIRLTDSKAFGVSFDHALKFHLSCGDFSDSIHS